MSQSKSSEVAISIKNLSFRPEKNKHLQVLAGLPFFRKVFSFWKLETSNIFDSISLEIKKGEFLGLFGECGAGKSTLLKLISGELVPSDGSVLIYEKERSSPSIRGRLIRITGTDRLFPQVSVLTKAHTRRQWFGYNQDDLDREIKFALEMLGVSERDFYEYEPIYGSVNTCPELVPNVETCLTSGTAFQVAVARASVLLQAYARRRKESGAIDNIDNVPPVLLIDSHSGALDIVSKERFYEAIRKLKSAIPDLTIVLATRDLCDLELCERLVVVGNGSLEDRTGGLDQIKAALAANPLPSLVRPLLE